MPRLAVRTPNWLGDAVMALPALQALRRAEPDLVLWSAPRVSALFGLFLPGIRVVGETRLPRGEFRRVLLLTDSFRTALQAVLSGIPERQGRPGQLRRSLLTHPTSPTPPRNAHHSLDYVELAEAAGAAGPWTLPEAPGPPSGDLHAALFPGARYGSAKLWGGYRDLAARLHDRLGLPVVLYGASLEERELLRLADRLPFAVVETGHDLAGLAARLRRAVLAVGNDSGGVHLASALGVPTAAIFGSSSPVWTAPMGRATVCVVSPLRPSCSPCFRKRCTRRAEPPPCLASVSVDAVIRACSGLPGLAALEGA